MTPSGIEPATFRFVAQYLNHCATAVPDVLSVVSRFAIRLGCSSFPHPVSAQNAISWKSVYELCYGRKWSHYCCVSRETVWPFQTEYATLISRCCSYALLTAYLHGCRTAHIILYCRCFFCVASRCFCRRLRNIKKGTWCRLRPPDLPTVSACALVQRRRLLSDFHEIRCSRFLHIP
jgi:hypothetical protein